MMQAWQDYMANQTLSNAPVSDCAITDLSHLGVIRVSGSNKLEFLQGQLTNDIDKVSETHSQLSSYCSPKGRMLASFRILQLGNDLLLLLPMELLEPTLKRLSMFVLRADVQLKDVSDELKRVEISGGCASDLLPIDPPAADNDAVSHDEYTIVRIPGDRPRYLVISDCDCMEALWEEAKQVATPTSRESWALLDIRAGIPTVYESTKEAFVPQMANLQLIDGVSFTKGCYTGQEVVARMQYLGKLKRRMYRAKIDTGQTPTPGTELYSPTDASGQGSGKIVDAALSPDGGYEVLLITPISCAEANDLRLGDESGPAIEILDMPYAFESAD